MAYVEKPISIEQMLCGQVQEQSPLCDVIVKNGNWQKSFHWCVLVASPFFGSIYKSKFLEKQTGTVDIKIGTPLMIETALLFLYGQEPRITSENVTELLQLAEFFVIPNLKAACFSKLRYMEITNINCLKLLEVSSRYGMDLPRFWLYLRGHLPDIMRHQEALDLTKECVVALLADATLSYVTGQEWFHFIVCWIRKSPNRRIHFEELFRLIDLEGIDVDYINNIIKKEPLLASVENLEELLSNVVENQHRVLLVCDAAKDEFLMGFDFEKKTWYKFEFKELTVTTQFVDDYCIKRKPAGVKGKGYAEIYQVHKQRVFTQNLANNNISESYLTFGENDNHCALTNQVCFSDTSIIQISNNLFKKYATREQSLLNTEQISTSTLYTGTMQHEGGSIYMIPVLSFARHHVKFICTNNFKCIAMVTRDDILFLYEEHTCEFDSFRLLEDCGFQMRTNIDLYPTDELAPTASGFVIYNCKGVFYISRLSGPALRKKYKMGQVAFNDKFSLVRYQFCENVWFRFTREDKSWKVSRYELRCVSHEDLLASEKGIKVEWRRMPLVSTLIKYACLNKKVYIVSLPRRALKCHLECPHCIDPPNRSLIRVSDTESSDVNSSVSDPSETESSDLEKENGTPSVSDAESSDLEKEDGTPSVSDTENSDV